MNGLAIGLLHLLAGASQGYFAKKQQISKENQDAQKEYMKRADKFADTMNKENKEAAERLYKLGLDSENPGLMAKSGLVGLEDAQSAIASKKAAKAAGKEGKPSVSAAAGKMSKTSKKQTGAITEPIMGKEITGPPMRMGTQLQAQGGQIGTTTGYTPEMQQLEQLGNVMEFKEATGSQAPQQYLEEAGFGQGGRAYKPSEVGEPKLADWQVSEYVKIVNDLDDDIRRVENQIFDGKISKAEGGQKIAEAKKGRKINRLILADIKAYVTKNKKSVPPDVLKKIIEKHTPAESSERKSGLLEEEILKNQGVSEGATATNQKTGKRIIFKDGQWQPMN